MSESVRVLGSVLVRNEDIFVERAIRNAAAFCDRIYAFDHQSDDHTWDALRGLAQELEHLEVRRTPRTTDSHRPFEPHAGTRTWVLGIDGDELYDPTGLARLRDQLLDGRHEDVFRLKAHVLNCDALDLEAGTASGFMAPPSRPVTKLFNLAAVESWSGCSQRLHDGRPHFRPGFAWDSMRYLSHTLSWEHDPLRCLHACFLPRSSCEGEREPRRNVNETGEWDRSAVGLLKRKLRQHSPPNAVAALHREGTNWKREWYARGERVTVDATPFI
jgi:hypothetical protein